MKPTALLLAASLLAASCARSSAQTAANSEDAEVAQMKTIESVDASPKVIDPPPVLSDEAPPPKPKQLPWQPPQEIVLSPEDEKVRANLPFAPAIAMDPINGDKISIRASTPMFEYKGHIYYFSNEENKKTFAANPEVAAKGGFTKL